MAFGADVRITGADQLARLAAAAKAAGNGQLRKDLLKGLRLAAKPVAESIKDQARSDLPGGLGESYGSAKLAPRTRTTGKGAGVRIQGPKKGQGADMGRVNDTGQVGHPVFGNRAVWARNSVPSGFAERGGEQAAPTARLAMTAVMQETVARISRSV